MPVVPSAVMLMLALSIDATWAADSTQLPTSTTADPMQDAADPVWACVFEGASSIPSKDKPGLVDLLRSAVSPTSAKSLPPTWDGCMRFGCPQPDACVREHHAMAKAVMRALECSKATWLPVYGTLLGLVRNQVHG
jgi:hypothetical protein